jgi:hypothetical protein
LNALLASLNQRIYDALGDGDEFRMFSLKSGSDSYQQWVEFLGEPIWTSEDDGREYRLQDGKHEPLEGFLLGEILKACANAAKLSDHLNKPLNPTE